ncbi:MAG TPA: hypothetical protein PKC57_02975, partial [Microthrixaceae bacterium]|nr:hypothetical protein [Microthrixaceae bacterium]
MTPMRTSADLVGYTGEPAPVVERRPVLRLTRVQVMIVAISAVVTAAVAAGFVSLQAPVYNTTRSVIVLSGSNPNDNDVLSRALESLASSKGMAAEVKRRGNLDLSIDQIAGMISTRRSPESPYMDVVVSSPDQKLSEAVSAQVIPAMRGVFDQNQAEIPAEQRIPGPIFQEVFAKPLQSTSTFPVWFAALFGALLGGLVPYLIFLFRNLRKPVVASAQDVTDAIDLPILVKVPVLAGRGGNAQDAVAGVISAVERLSLNEPIHRLVLVGADNGIDRSALALALACVVARSFGQPVALVDADLERGTLTGMVNAEDVAGLSECLAGQLDPEKALLTLSDAQIPRDLDGIAAPEGMVRFLGAGVDRSR